MGIRNIDCGGALPSSDHTLDLALSLVRTSGTNGLTYLALRPQSRVYVSAGGQACLGYRMCYKTALVLGQPAGTPKAVAALVSEFAAHTEVRGWHNAYCGVHADFASTLANAGYLLASVGDNATVDPQGLSLRGLSWREVRAAMNRAAKAGLRFSWVEPRDRDAVLLQALRDVTADWLAYRRLPELRYALGDLRGIVEPDVRVGVATTAGGQPAGFITWVPVSGRGGWMLELLRTRRNILAGIADFLVASSLQTFQTEGCAYADLGGTPLASHGESNRSLPWLVRTVICSLRGLYDCAGLMHFKQKFNPTWNPTYLAYRGKAGWAGALLAATLACARPDGFSLDRLATHKRPLHDRGGPLIRQSYGPATSVAPSSDIIAHPSACPASHYHPGDASQELV